MRKNKGITLIALVITIIVLLILAAVSIATLTGENGILKRAQEASIKNEYMTVYDVVRLETEEYIINKNTDIIQNGYIEWMQEKGIIGEEEDKGKYPIKSEIILGEISKNGKYYLEEDGRVNKIGKIASKTLVNIAKDITSEVKYKVIFYSKKENEMIDLGYVYNGNVQKNIEEVLEQATAHPSQDLTNTDIGVDSNGNSVNLDLWYYEIIDDTQMCLGSTELGGYATSIKPGYIGTLIDGKIQGTVPQYIKKGGKWYTVTKLSILFQGDNNQITYAPAIPEKVKTLYHTFQRMF